MGTYQVGENSENYLRFLDELGESLKKNKIKMIELMIASADFLGFMAVKNGMESQFKEDFVRALDFWIKEHQRFHKLDKDAQMAKERDSKGSAGE